jgi:hypothetical protein
VKVQQFGIKEMTADESGVQSDESIGVKELDTHFK